MVRIHLDVPVTRIKVIGGEPEPGLHHIRDISMVLKPDLSVLQKGVQTATAVNYKAFLLGEDRGKGENTPRSIVDLFNAT